MQGGSTAQNQIFKIARSVYGSGMIDNSTSNIKTIRLDCLPVLFEIIEELQAASILDRLIPAHPNWAGEISPGQVVVGWLVFILSTQDHRLNHVEDWVTLRADAYAACLRKPVRGLDFSDDRLAYLLDKLSETQIWSAFETKLNQRIIRVYDLHPEFIRLDPTTVSTYAMVTPDGLLQLGHSKDRRPEDAQLKIQLATLDPLGLPLVTLVVSGNSADDPLYAPAITQVQASLGKGGKTYIGDSKMGARETRALLVSSRDYYLCPLGEKQLPAAERETLIAAALRAEKSLTPINRERQDPLGIKPPVVEQIAAGYEASAPMQVAYQGRTVRWTERRLVVRSDAYANSQAAQLDERLNRAEKELGELLTRKQGKRRRSAQETQAAAAEIVVRYRLNEMLLAEVTTRRRRRKVRAYKDRPARVRIETEISIKVSRDQAAVQRFKERLGWRIYATNHPRLPLTGVVLAYREQYQIEHGIRRLKGRPLGLSPMYLLTDSRMIGLINLLTIALRVLTLIEFRVRQELAAEGKTLTGIYAGQKGRQTMRPSTELLLKAFEGIDAVVGTHHMRPLSHLSPLTATQQRLLHILGLDALLYDNLLSYFQNLP
jgi:transposase